MLAAISGFTSQLPSEMSCDQLARPKLASLVTGVRQEKAVKGDKEQQFEC
jgi:hypothetical protein